MENEIEITKPSKIKKNLKKPIIKLILAILIIVIIFSVIKNLQKNNEEENTDDNNVKQVQIMTIGENNEDNVIETVGTVKAKTKIDITALTSGIVKNLFFEIGDYVDQNKIIANLYDKATLTNLINARTDYLNRQNSLNATERINDELINQAELAVKSAEEAIGAAEIGLKTAKDNLENSKSLKDKNIIDTKNNAVISFGGYLNTINSTLDQVNYIIKAEGNAQLAGIENTLGINSPGSVTNATNDYFIVKNDFDSLSLMNVDNDNIRDAMSEIVLVLNQTKNLVDDTIIVLENTQESDSISESTITTQKNNFYSLRTTVVSAQSSAVGSLQALDNLSLTYNQEITALENAVRAAENQLVSSQTNYNNALISLGNVLNSKDQNIISAQSALDNAQGQYNLAGTQAADLNVKAPISGQITKKYIELGTEVNPGQKIAELSQTDLLIIEVDLAVDDIKEIRVGEEVNINDELRGAINQIYPTADAVSKKVKVEVLFDNSEEKLIAESFVDVSISLNNRGSDTVFVPLKSVNITPTERFVFVAENGQAKKVPVEIGEIEGDKIEIITGINNGDKLITEGSKNLEEGSDINIAE